MSQALFSALRTQQGTKQVWSLPSCSSQTKGNAFKNRWVISAKRENQSQGEGWQEGGYFKQGGQGGPFGGGDI